MGATFFCNNPVENRHAKFHAVFSRYEKKAIYSKYLQTDILILSDLRTPEGQAVSDCAWITETEELHRLGPLEEGCVLEFGAKLGRNEQPGYCRLRYPKGFRVVTPVAAPPAEAPARPEENPAQAMLANILAKQDAERARKLATLRVVGGKKTIRCDRCGKQDEAQWMLYHGTCRNCMAQELDEQKARADAAEARLNRIHSIVGLLDNARDGARPNTPLAGKIQLCDVICDIMGFGQERPRLRVCA